MNQTLQHSHRILIDVPAVEEARYAAQVARRAYDEGEVKHRAGELDRETLDGLRLAWEAMEDSLADTVEACAIAKYCPWLAVDPVLHAILPIVTGAG